MNTRGNEQGYMGTINEMVLSGMVHVNSGGKEFELAETFIPEIDEVIGRRFGDSLARAFRRYSGQGTPVLVKKVGKSCYLYTKVQ